MIRTESTIRVRYVETDAMGLVHHASYVPWLELARIDMLDQLGLSYKQLEADGYLLPVLGVSLQYKKPAYFDDRVTVICKVVKKPNIRMSIGYEIYRAETLLCTGSSDHAFVNKEGKPVRPPKHFVRLFEKALKEAGVS